MSYDWTPPETFWVVSAGVCIRADRATAHRVSDEWERGDKILVFQDLEGSECRIPAVRFEGIWESSPDIRSRAAAFGKMLDAEREDFTC